MQLSRLGRLTAMMALAAALPAPKFSLADVDAVPEPIIFRAIRSGDELLLQSLLREGRSPNRKLEDGTTALMSAALFGSPDSVKQLLDHGADAKAANQAGVTALLWGAGDPDKVKWLLEAGADPNSRSRIGVTPLMAASRRPGREATEAVKQLLEAGATADGELESNRSGRGPLENAATAGNTEVVRMLLGAGIEQRKNRALARAVEFGKIEVVQILLDAGADPNAINGGAGHSLDIALLSNRPAVAKLLLERGAAIDTATRNGKVPPVVLASFTETGDDSVLLDLIRRGADVNATNDRGENASAWAVRRGHSHLVKALVAAGAAAPTQPVKEKEVPDRNIDLHAGNRQELLVGSIGKSLALLQKSSDVFLRNRESCVSCHHQNLPAVAFGWARERGFQLDEASIARLVERQDRWMQSRVERAYQMDEPTPVPPRLIGWGLLGYAALDRPADRVSDALVYYLAAIQQPDGHWDSRSLRPPMGGGEILSTVLAMRTLQNYPPPGDPKSTAAQIQLAQTWLRGADPQTHQEEVFRLLGLAWSGVGLAELTDDGRALLEQQRSDGGWAQLPGLESDAWATGQTLVALAVAGLPTTHPNYRRGLAFLLNTQFDDGSWFVATRTWPFQPHFDSQFPHGRDQWISAGATAWAAMAMTLAAERTEIADPEVEAPAVGPLDEDGPGTSPAKPAGTGDIPEIDFVTHVKPLLERSCVGCHGAEGPKGNFRVTDRDGLLSGGESGIPAITVGRGVESPLVRQLRGLVEDMEMPPLGKREKYPALSEEEVGRISAWIDGGAPWPEGVAVAPTSEVVPNSSSDPK